MLLDMETLMVVVVCTRLEVTFRKGRVPVLSSYLGLDLWRKYPVFDFAHNLDCLLGKCEGEDLSSSQQTLSPSLRKKEVKEIATYSVRQNPRKMREIALVHCQKALRLHRAV